MAGARIPAPILYHETRLSPAAPTPSTLLLIDTGASKELNPFGAGRKRTFEEISGNGEDAYARKYLATEGSVFFRAKDKTPRSFLWRILDDRHLLEIQCVDLIETQEHRGSDCWLTYHISFPHGIDPNGVALADAVGRDALEIFVLSGSELYTITLKRDLLLRETVPKDFDPAFCVKKFTPGNLQPYRLIAVSSLELFISSQNGGFRQLQRESHDSQWRETYFSEGGWGTSTLKSWAKWQTQTMVKYGDLSLDARALVAMVKSPDGKHVWSLGLDHMLKAWNMSTGKVERQIGALHEELGPEERKRQRQYVMSAEQGTLLQIQDAQGVANVGYFLVLHSPKDHQFKFYGASLKEDENQVQQVALEDAQSSAEPLIAPIAEMMGTSMWHLEHFYVSPGLGWRDNQIWIRARSGVLCRTFMLSFDLLGERGVTMDLSDLWKTGWSIVDDTSLSIDALRESLDFLELDPSTDTIATPSEKWLEFLFYPGRFSEASLEAALSIYRKGRNLPTNSSRRHVPTEEPLKERITSAISAKILLHRLENEQPDYGRYQLDLQAQWQAYFSILSHLHTRRHESVGFAYDAEEALPWSVCADFVAPIRASDAFELVYNNTELAVPRWADPPAVNQSVLDRIWADPDEDIMKSQVLAIARQLRHYLSPAAQEKLRRTAIMEALEQSTDNPLDALHLLYERCNVPDEITNDDFDAITDAASSFDGLGALTEDDFLAVLEELEKGSEMAGTNHGRALLKYGKEFSITLAQETLQRAQAVLLDLLALVVFMHGDLEHDELSEQFRPADVYEAISLRLKHTELRLWLVSHIRLEPKKIASRKDELLAMTLYESIFIGDWEAREVHRMELTKAITMWSKAWALGGNLNDNWIGITDYIMANLLKAKDIDLATEFVKFLTDTPFATYLKGRLSLATGEYSLASLSFREAAEDMASLPKGQVDLPHSHLLTADEMNFLGRGLSQYFQHVSSLFEHLKAFAYTADFAALALQSLQSVGDLRREIAELDKRKSQAGPDSPVSARIDDAMEEIRLLKLRKTRDDILGRLFNALHQTGRFEEAYHALVQISDPALQKSNLSTLLNRCIKEGSIPALLSLPITGDLIQTADAELLKLAKRSMGVTNTAISGPPYHQILFAFRAQHGDYRGAASLLYLHLQHLRHTNPKGVLQDPEDETLVQVYVLLINTLACCPPDEAWLLADPIPGMHTAGTMRKLVRLEDVRREYVDELDRRSEVQMGRFPLVVSAGNMDMDMF